MYVKLTNGLPEKYPYPIDEIRADNPQTSFPTNLSDALLAEWDIFAVKTTPQPEYTSLQYLEEGTPVFNGDQWQQVWVVVDKTPEQIAQEEAAAKAANKSQAESLLQQTDWTATVDISNPEYSNPYLGNQPEFLAYRSAVRKIAVNPPVTVDVWPIKPDEVWIDV